MTGAVHRRPLPRLTAFAIAVDSACVVLFVAVGRRNHDADPALGGTLRTAAPFLIALAVAWLAVRPARSQPLAVRSGLLVALVTVTGGLVLRRVGLDDGTALPFVIVTTIVLGALLTGWRAGATHLGAIR